MNIKQEEIKRILELHKKWLLYKAGGERADFNHTDLDDADLSNAKLRFVNLCGATLRNAILSKADLANANLHNAVLSKADLHNANLSGAILWNVNLRDVNLRDVNLRKADLRGADLRGADLSNADLYGADLYGANLRDADLRGADLRGANLSEANLPNVKLDTKENFRKGVVVKRGINGWKRCRDGVLVKLKIPRGAIVFCINGSKCRTNIAKVVKIIGAKEGISMHDNEFVYKVGRTYKIDDFCLMYNVEYASGIHFFRTRKEAQAWGLL